MEARVNVLGIQSLSLISGKEVEKVKVKALTLDLRKRNYRTINQWGATLYN